MPEKPTLLDYFNLASEGILYGVDVDAESLYEAVAIALPALVKTM